MTVYPTPNKNIVLVGGGHAHALVLRSWRTEPAAGAHLTVINPSTTAPYTGMLPGYIAGHYRRDELDYDLQKLAQFAEGNLIVDKAIGIDRQTQTVTLEKGPPVPYDICSINVGVTSVSNQLPGFSDHAVPAKPLGPLATRWTEFVHKWTTRSDQPSVAIIGGGVAGCELAMAMSYRLRRDGHNPKVSVFDTSSILNEVGQAARRKLRIELTNLDIDIREHTNVDAIAHDHLSFSHNGSNGQLQTDFIVGAAGAHPFQWISELGLATTNGFIDVGETLQTTTDPNIFAVGDCAHLTHAPRPKAGVFAVRQAPYLLKNIKATLQGAKLETFDPQTDYLKLVSLGKKSAGADKFGRFTKGGVVWQLKDRIDRKFMSRLEDLPTIEPSGP